MIDTLIQADIFFFITAVAVVVITIALLVALAYFIQILRDVRYVTRRIREESDRVLSDVEHLRGFIKKEGEKVLDVKEFLGGVIGTFLSKRKSSRNRKEKGKAS